MSFNIVAYILPIFFLFGCSTTKKQLNEQMGNNNHNKLMSYIKTKKEFLTDTSFIIKKYDCSIEEKEICISNNKIELQNLAIKYISRQLFNEYFPQEYIDMFSSELEKLVLKYSSITILNIHELNNSLQVSSKITINLNFIKTEFIQQIEKKISNAKEITERKKIVGYYVLAQLYKNKIYIDKNNYIDNIRIAAKYQLKEAQFDLGIMHLKGNEEEHIVADKTKALYWLKKSLDNNNSYAAVVLYLIGEKNSVILSKLKNEVNMEVFKIASSYVK